jgi:hypothetical protein
MIVIESFVWVLIEVVDARLFNFASTLLSFLPQTYTTRQNVDKLVDFAPTMPPRTGIVNFTSVLQCLSFLVPMQFGVFLGIDTFHCLSISIGFNHISSFIDWTRCAVDWILT